MTSRTKPTTLSLAAAFEAEQARREDVRREREAAERRQQEQDLERAEELEAAIRADALFLADKGLVLDRRRYTVSLDHVDFRIAAYFEAGRASVTAADKRTTLPGASAPRKREQVDTVAQALDVMAQFLADEFR
ncbi:MAG TPA: hypothetical protein VFE18_02070 [Phenylobacterium sp.]|jgi:hypothetical protein|uniref:hypothetical protein n=1 Tax=Phenylobacterium sp. TaxID=1871053 RepID=UPI002D453D74|nr:hypothetical protein [Phenylobacterium sp.]HZZ66935.1 hypothetical protein [Phenylobacterium sp.]